MDVLKVAHSVPILHILLGHFYLLRAQCVSTLRIDVYPKRVLATDGGGDFGPILSGKILSFRQYFSLLCIFSKKTCEVFLKF